MNDVDTILKIGGEVLDSPALLNGVLDEVAGAGGNVILVHGGGKEVSRISERLGLQARMVEGRRLTDAATLDVLAMVCGGKLNRSLVAALQARGCNALGLSGADCNLISARRRPVRSIDYGYVGDIEQVNAEVLHNLLRAGLTPVIAPLTHDGAGTLLNTNADSIAAEIAAAISIRRHCRLVYCFSHAGVLMDLANPHSRIPLLDEWRCERLIEAGQISAGMRPKLSAAFRALRYGVDSVRICAAQDAGRALRGEAVGTEIVVSNTLACDAIT